MMMEASSAKRSERPECFILCPMRNRGITYLRLPPWPGLVKIQSMPVDGTITRTPIIPPIFILGTPEREKFYRVRGVHTT